MKQGILFSFGFVVRRNINFKSKDWEVQIHCHYFDIQSNEQHTFKLTGMLTNHVFRFVPAPPTGKFDHIYTDKELYKDFNLPQKYIDVIEAVVKERN